MPSVYDARSGYHQCPVRKEDQWLTAFVCGSQLYEWTRCPFGMRSSGCTFVRAIKQIIDPLKDFTESYVDELAVYSESWRMHLRHTQEFLSAIRASGLTLNFSKSIFAKPEVKFIGHLVGSGHRRVDPDKISSITGIKNPETKKQLRQIIGLFSFFREYIPNFSYLANTLTDLTGKRVSNRIPWGQEQQNAFDKLKSLLCDATTRPSSIIDSSKPFNVSVDASEYSVGGILTQTRDGNEQPVAFISAKLTPTQRRWSVIEKEAYAVIWALKKFRHWVFNRSVVVYSDHNPLAYLTEPTPKSSKLLRWALALQEFVVELKYRCGRNNEAADCLSRMVFGGDEESPAA